ncbi:MAG TPA: gliding motility-associated C-terminal domain-containing protein, partial [Saprospiraceae bacterium]
IDIPQYTIAWVDLNNDTISIAGSLLVSDAGPFIVSVSGTNTCETRDTILVTIDTIAPVAMVSLTGEIKCKNRDAVLDGTASTPVPLSYGWTTLGGNILSNPSLVQINARDTGYYYLSVQRLDNGCTDSASLHLVEDTDAITLAYLDIVPPACHGDEVASITVTSLDGGVGPFQYQLDGSAFQSSPAFTDLDAGTFLITIADADQCEYDTTVVIEPTPEFMVDAGPDQEIYLGETAQLIGMTVPSQDNLMTDSWTSAGSLVCTDCPQFDVIPLETTTYTYQVTTGTGCVREDEMIIYVLEKGKYYLPNVFSPNGDGINDEIRIIPSPGVERVLQWVVFDRWGNAAFGKTDFDPSDPAVFWDGRSSTGEEVNPGVFAYILEIQLINGNVEVHHGDITVIR